MQEIHAPWTDEQVTALNTFQLRGRLHPFTCGRRSEHPHNEGILTARTDGWQCPVPTCPYRQTWAPAFMADPSLLSTPGETPVETFQRINDTRNNHPERP